MNKYVCHALSQAAIFKKIKLIPKINLKPKKMIGAPFAFAINWDRLHAASLIAVTLFILSVCIFMFYAYYYAYVYAY